MSYDPRDLIPLYTDDTSIRLRCVGGPHDGQTHTWNTSNGQPLPLLHLPVTRGLSFCDFLEPGVRPSLSVAVYRPQLDKYGLPSRDDAGVYRYEYDGRCY